MSAGADANPYGERYCPTCERAFESGDRCPEDGTRLVRLATGDDALVGRELDGRYTILERIGRGGMGTVYRGNQHSVGREVAIKVVMPTLVADPIVIKRFLREAKLSSSLSHPNAVSMLDFGQTDDGLFYLVMELVNGRTLEAVLATENTLPAPRIVRIGVQVCEALDGAHALKIVHRDLKPANVMLLSSGRDLVKVLDFGLAKSLTPRVGGATMTNVGAMLGTPSYMPPELVTGQECDHRADLYSLGVVLYLTASGRLPFAARTVHELIAMHASEPPAPLVEVPTRLAHVIHKLLAKEPSDRYQSAAEARDALERALDDSTGDDSTTLRAPTSTISSWGLTPVQGVPVRPPVPVPVAPPVRPALPRPTTDEQPTLARRSDAIDIAAVIVSPRPGSDPPPPAPASPKQSTDEQPTIAKQFVDEVSTLERLEARSDAARGFEPLPTEIMRPVAPAGLGPWLLLLALALAFGAGLAVYLVLHGH